MPVDALDRIIHPYSVVAHRDGTLWLYQSARNGLGYAFPARVEHDGRVVPKSTKTELVRMHDLLLVAITHDMREWDRATWQKWWAREARRQGRRLSWQ